jgi:hypothetical protein
LQAHKKLISTDDDDIIVMRTNRHYCEVLNVMNSLASCHHSCLEVKIERQKEREKEREKEQEKEKEVNGTGGKKSYRYDDDVDAREAIRLYTECLRERQIVLGENHPDTLLTTNNLAGVYITLERFELAAPLLVQAFSKRLIVLGENHPETLVSMFCLGMLYDKEASTVVSAGHHSKDMAKGLYETCLVKRCQILGENHPETERVRNALIRLN